MSPDRNLRVSHTRPVGAMSARCHGRAIMDKHAYVCEIGLFPGLPGR
jgi:hypothetical protein